MANYLGLDEKSWLYVSLAVSSSVAAYSTYRLWGQIQAKTDENIYESKRSLYEYLALHYGTPEQMLKWEFGPKEALDFPKRCAELCVKYYKDQTGVPNRALDIGCAVGRSSFELTRSFGEVIGMDYSQSFVNACTELREKGQMEYDLLIEGDITQRLQASIDPSLPSERASFQQGDACCLPESLGQFGCVLAANLICRLHTPQDFLTRMSSLIAPGGILVLTSPYTFLREFTPRENWIGSFMVDGKPFTGLDGLKAAFKNDFDLIAEENLPFFIRETARKNQWTVAHATIWQRK